ncbi:MAG: phosphatase PAP2 family protein [Bacteroidota bacterium]|nr:phosphatase PAP2 family protein [Bacteroidota bacterium]
MNKGQAAELLPFHPAVRMAAKVVSYLFHPLFVPVYMALFFVYTLRLFPGQDEWHHTMLIIQFFISYTLLPLATVLIAKGLGFVKTVYLKTQKDRIIPYMATMIFYFWMWYVSKNLSFPKESVMFSLAIFLATCLGVFFNTYFKVSMHALSMGIAVTLLLILSTRSSANFGSYLSIVLFIAGLVCTARLINNDHRPFDVYAGLLLGSVAQLIAWIFV